MPTDRYIDTPQALEELCHTLAESDWFCLDTEFIREKTYYPRLCLIQVATPDVVACIDPLAVEDLSPLSTLLHDPGITKVLHAASQDMEIFYYLDEQLPAPVFDTQIAASLMGLGDQVGYGKLVEDMLQVNLDKSHSRTDWSQRPLQEEQIRYAADDVRYLRDIYLQQREWLIEHGRLPWLDEDFKSLCDPKRYRPDPDQAWKRVKGIQRLKPEQLMVLKELAGWREHKAMDSNRPKRWVLKDEVLLELARRAPQKLDDLARIRGLEPGQVRNSGEHILELIKQARQKSREEWPKLPKRIRLTADQDTIADLLMASLRLSGIEASISVQAIATRKEVEQLVAGERNLNLLRGWRLELAGRELLYILDGHSTLVVKEGKVERINPGFTE
jgi:ribonuclease D